MKKIGIWAAALLLAAALALGAVVFAAQAYSSADDPLISLSYINDVLLPQIYAGDRLTHEDLIRLGDGGLCRLCKPCHFPTCTFGRY